MSNFGRYEDYFQTFYVKQLEQKRETHKKTNNPILLKQIKELENLLYKNWLIIIPEEKPKVSKQLEFEF